jgi:hypothetical protein
MNVQRQTRRQIFGLRKRSTEDVAGKMRVNTQEAAKLLGIELTTLRLLMRKGKIKAPPIAFDCKRNSTGRMWSEDDIEQARKALENIKSTGD